jgi:hypothetical protein
MKSILNYLYEIKYERGADGIDRPVGLKPMVVVDPVKSSSFQPNTGVSAALRDGVDKYLVNPIGSTIKNVVAPYWKAKLSQK